MIGDSYPIQQHSKSCPAPLRSYLAIEDIPHLKDFKMVEPTMVSKLAVNGPGLLDLCIQTVLLFLCFVSVGLRLWSRKLQRKELQLNDWLIVAAMVSRDRS